MGTLDIDSGDAPGAAIEPERRGHDLIYGIVLVVAILATFGFAWLTANFGGRAGVFVVLAAGVVGAIAVIVAGIVRDRRTWAITVSVLGLAVATLLASWLALDGVLVAAKHRSQLDELESIAQGWLEDLPPVDERGPGLSMERVEVEGLGSLEEVMISSLAGVESAGTSGQLPRRDHVRFSAPATNSGLIYQPAGDEPYVSSFCIAHVAGPWWETAPADGNCPYGFEFKPGG